MLYVNDHITSYVTVDQVCCFIEVGQCISMTYINENDSCRFILDNQLLIYLCAFTSIICISSGIMFINLHGIFANYNAQIILFIQTRIVDVISGLYCVFVLVMHFVHKNNYVLFKQEVK